MGASIEVESFEKQQDCISGYIEVLEWYEVKYHEIVPYAFREHSLTIYGGLSSVDALFRDRQTKREFGFYDDGEFSFFYNIMNNFSGASMRTEGDTSYGLMFGPHKLLSFFKKLHAAIDYIESTDFDKVEEKKDVEYLVDLLEFVAQKDGLVSFTWG